MGEYHTSQMLWVTLLQLAIQILPGVAACAYALYTSYVDNPGSHYVVGGDERDRNAEEGFLPQQAA